MEISRFRHRRTRFLRKPVPGSVGRARSQARTETAGRERAFRSCRLVLVNIAYPFRPRTVHDGKRRTAEPKRPCSLFSSPMNEKNRKTSLVPFRPGKLQYDVIVHLLAALESDGVAKVHSIGKLYTSRSAFVRLFARVTTSRAGIWRTACDGSLSSPFRL
jgi:hypothetical protein